LLVIYKTTAGVCPAVLKTKMSGFAFQNYERVPGVGDEEYNHNDPMMRAAATEQRTRDYFVSPSLPDHPHTIIHVGVIRFRM